MGLCASTPSQPPTQDPATTTTTDPTSIPTLTSTTTTSLTTNASSSTTDQVKVTSSFMRRIAANMRSGNQRSTQKDFKPSIQFLTIISSPTTPFNVYSRIILTEVLRTISGEYCILHMVDDVREQILSCYFPKINGTAIASGIGKDSSMASSSSGRKQQKDRPIFWTTDLKDDNNEEEERSLVAKTCLEGHAYNLEDVTRHKSFNPKKDLPLGLQLSQLKSFCIQPIRYMGDQTRIIGAITVVDKDGIVKRDNSNKGKNKSTSPPPSLTTTTTTLPFSRRDVTQLLQICLQVSDSMYRQRVRAIESNGDSDAHSLLAHYNSEHQDAAGRRFRQDRNNNGGSSTMSTINETSNNGNSSSGSSSGSSGLQNISTNDQVDPSMGVSPISKRVATGDGSNDNHQKRTLKRTNTASRNEASLNDVLVYRWPNTSASTRLEEDGMMLEDDNNNNKDNSNNDNNNDNNNDLNDLSRRGIPVIELGVPENFRTLDFSALDYSNERLERFVLSIMRDTGMVHHFSIPPARLIRWTRAVRSSYQDNPFHNWYHGFSVFHFSYYQLYISDISTFLHPLDIFGLLVAAICHDSDHPGLTNKHLTDTEDDLTIHYNDVSVLENHHAYICCQLLRTEETKISCYLSRADQRELRKIVITAILHTDMSTHDKTCQKIMNRDRLRPFRSDRVTDRQTLINICIHCSDLSAQVLPWISASRWEERISQEFDAQAKKEMKLGMIPSPMMMNLDDMKVRGKGQMGFIDYVLVKLWDPMSMMFKELRPCYKNLIKNRRLYEQRWKTGVSGAPLPPPQPIIKVERRHSSHNVSPPPKVASRVRVREEQEVEPTQFTIVGDDNQSSRPKHGVGTVDGKIASKYVLAHNVNRARQKFISYGQKRGSPAKPDR